MTPQKISFLRFLLLLFLLLLLLLLFLLFLLLFSFSSCSSSPPPPPPPLPLPLLLLLLLLLSSSSSSSLSFPPPSSPKKDEWSNTSHPRRYFSFFALHRCYRVSQEKRHIFFLIAGCPGGCVSPTNPPGDFFPGR